MSQILQFLQRMDLQSTYYECSMNTYHDQVSNVDDKQGFVIQDDIDIIHLNKKHTVTLYYQTFNTTTWSQMEKKIGLAMLDREIA